MSPVQIFITVIYAIASGLLLLYGLNAYVMIYFSMDSRRNKAAREPGLPENIRNWPAVTIQLPIYNEQNVADRVIRAAASMDYPGALLEIQVLDDSTDQTVEIVDRTVLELRSQGMNIQALRRPDREGFKAGALAFGTARAKGEFLAVFDADFLPKPDFLKRTIPYFLVNEKIAFIQTRWGHLNPQENLLTKCLSLGIDGHFLVEQPARVNGSLFMNFNGTAGVWRKEAIDEAGGWSSATLTEDLDLSYRVQLAGWTPYYLGDVVVPAEVPSTMAGVKSQQFRWAKGSMQTAIMLLPRVWRGPYSAFQKIQAFIHLTNYSVHPMMLTLAVLALPVLTLNLVKMSPWFFAAIALPLLAATLGPSTLYIVATLRNPERKLTFLLWLPFLVLYGTGIAISNSIAIFEAVIGKSSAFIRTPKKGDRRKSGYRLNRSRLWLAEIFLGIYSLGSMASSIISGNYLVLPFLSLFVLGFFSVGIRTAIGLTNDA